MTRIDNLFVMRLPNGNYVKMQAIKCGVGFNYIFTETNNVAEAERLLYAKRFSLPHKARALLDQQFPDIEFVQVEVQNTVKLKDA